MKVWEGMLPSFDGTELYVKKEIPEDSRAVAVIVHGICEHQGRYDHVAERLHESGIGTYRFDHRGHGRSQGERGHFSAYTDPLRDTDMVVDAAIGENPGLPVFLIGHSMGGFTVSLYGAAYPNKAIRGIVTSGAMTHDQNGTTNIPDGMDVTIQVPNELGPGICSVPEVVEEYGRDPYNGKVFTVGMVYALRDGVAWFSEAARDFAYPILMLHGEKDPIINVKDTLLFFDKAASTDRQMKIYGGLYHEIFNEYCRDEVIADAVNWILKRV